MTCSISVGSTSGGRRPVALEVRRYRHSLETVNGPIEVLTFLTVGLERLGHPEIRVTVPAAEQADVQSDEPARLLKWIHEAASQGQRVGPFGQTGFNQDWMGFRGVLYVDADDVPGFAEVDAPPGTLHGIFLKEREWAELMRLGCPMRQLTRLGDHYRHYPWPPWCDPARADVGPMPDSEPSMLAKLPWLPAWSSIVEGDGSAITLHVHSSERRDLAKSLATLPPAGACALSLGPATGIHGHYVWSPGQVGAAAIMPASRAQVGWKIVAPPNLRLGGCFVVFAPGADWSAAGQVEDGFVVVLTDLDWRRVRDAIERGDELTVASTHAEGLPFVVRPRQESYLNPVDGNEYRAKWAKYTPMGESKAPALPPGVTVSWRFLTSETDLVARMTVDDLAAFGQRAEATLVGLLTESVGAGELTIQFDCEPNGFEVRIAHRGSFSAAVLRMLESQLGSLDPIRATGAVSFQIEASFAEGRPSA